MIHMHIEPQQQTASVAQLSRLSGLDRRTVAERLELLAPAATRGRFRRWRVDAALDWLRACDEARALGLTLDDVCRVRDRDHALLGQFAPALLERLAPIVTGMLIECGATRAEAWQAFEQFYVAGLHEADEWAGQALPHSAPSFLRERQRLGLEAFVATLHEASDS